MFTLFVNSKSIASRNRSENWINEIKELYKRQNVDHVAMFKRLQKFKLSNVWIEATEINRTAMKKNIRDEIEQQRKNKKIHDNVTTMSIQIIICALISRVCQIDLLLVM